MVPWSHVRGFGSRSCPQGKDQRDCTLKTLFAALLTGLRALTGAYDELPGDGINFQQHQVLKAQGTGNAEARFLLPVALLSLKKRAATMRTARASLR